MNSPQKSHLVEKYGKQMEVDVYFVRYPNSIAAMATEFAKHFAMVAGTPDGEDSAGRAKIRIQTAEEVALRACDMAAAMWAQFEARGWIMDLPDPYEDEDSTSKTQ